jgi:hypothetical protein
MVGCQLRLAHSAGSGQDLADDRRPIVGHHPIEIFDRRAVLKAVGLVRDHADPLRPDARRAGRRIIVDPVCVRHGKAVIAGVDRNVAAEEVVGVRGRTSSMRAVSSRTA